MGHFSFSSLMFPQPYNNISSFNYTILISFTVFCPYTCRV